ncbi:hypothetical protein SBOR_6340 [Sclerotinia borealis F-4128]|uniref:2EXR domain-containing protein n=1 Tax=Sclerotinia borealis (strain F-4128) TaxID=1432307 RepID=W9C992_SCLBF|nr:hypothetical protein SBOR_6340 [Sclerotinia borealis F-4128]
MTEEIINKKMTTTGRRDYHRRRLLFNQYCQDRIVGADGVIRKRDSAEDLSAIHKDDEESEEKALTLDESLATLKIDDLVYDPEHWIIGCPTNGYGWDCFNDPVWNNTIDMFIWDEEANNHINVFKVKWEKDEYNTFTCFPRLPLELRCKIWKNAFPDPRVLSFQLQHYFTNEESLDLVDVSVAFHCREFIGDTCTWVCWESQKVFLENYTQLIPSTDPTKFEYGDKRAERVGFSFYINPEIDTLMFDMHRHERSNNRWLEKFKLQLDLSKVQHLALGYKFNQYRQEENAEGDIWSYVKVNFPGLRNFDFILEGTSTSERLRKRTGGDIDVGHQGLAWLNDETLEALSYNITTVGDSRKTRCLRAKLDKYLEDAKELKTEYSEVLLADPDYWGKVNFNIALFTIEILNRGEEMVLLRKNVPHDTLFFTSILPYPQDRVEFYDLEEDFACKEDGTLYHQYQGVKELFESES